MIKQMSPEKGKSSDTVRVFKLWALYLLYPIRATTFLFKNPFPVSIKHNRFLDDSPSKTKEMRNRSKGQNYRLR
jgi:hypothetical protein